MGEKVVRKWDKLEAKKRQIGKPEGKGEKGGENKEILT